MPKILDLTKSVYDLCQEYPEVIDIMAGLGFTDITKKVALNTMGRVMTIPKGSEIKEIPMDKIVTVFEEQGFEIEGYEKPDEAELEKRTVSNVTIEKREAARVQAETVGHPLNLFTKENEAFEKEIESWNGN